MSKLNSLFDDMIFIHNTFYGAGEFAVCGTRGWLLPHITVDWDEHDDKIYRRELMRLEAALKKASDAGYKKIIAALHYPVTDFRGASTEFTKIIEKYPVKNVWLVYLGWCDLSKLPLTKQESKIIEDYNRLKTLELKNDYELYKEFKDSEKESILLYAIMVDDKKVFHYFKNLADIKLNITGKDLQNMGIKPSKKYSECFEYILKQKIQNPQIALEFFKQ